MHMFQNLLEIATFSAAKTESAATLKILWAVNDYDDVDDGLVSLETSE